MKNAIIFIATLLVSGFAMAQSPAIEGNWGMQQSMNGINFNVTFSISNNSVTITNVCTGFGTTATVHVTVAASYDDSNLTIHETRQAQESNSGLNCNVGAQQDTMHYSVQGNALTFTHDGSSESFVLMRK